MRDNIKSLVVTLKECVESQNNKMKARNKIKDFEVSQHHYSVQEVLKIVVEKLERIIKLDEIET